MEELRGNNNKSLEHDWSIGDYALCFNNGPLLLRPHGVNIAIRVAATLTLRWAEYIACQRFKSAWTGIRWI